MKDTVLYEQLLGLKSPWSVKKVDLWLPPLCQTRCYGCLPFLKGMKLELLRLNSR